MRKIQARLALLLVFLTVWAVPALAEETIPLPVSAETVATTAATAAGIFTNLQAGATDGFGVYVCHREQQDMYLFVNAARPDSRVKVKALIAGVWTRIDRFTTDQNGDGYRIHPYAKRIKVIAKGQEVVTKRVKPCQAPGMVFYTTLGMIQTDKPTKISISSVGYYIHEDWAADYVGSQSTCQQQYTNTADVVQDWQEITERLEDGVPVHARYFHPLNKDYVLWMKRLDVRCQLTYQGVPYETTPVSVGGSGNEAFGYVGDGLYFDYATQPELIMTIYLYSWNADGAQAALQNSSCQVQFGDRTYPFERAGSPELGSAGEVWSVRYELPAQVKLPIAPESGTIDCTHPWYGIVRIPWKNSITGLGQ